MIEVPYDEHLWELAAERARRMPVYAGSHRKAAANEVGALGEVVFEDYLARHGIPFTPRYVTTDDLELFGATVDVKTKDRTVHPRPHHGCSVPLYNHEHQRPSLYVFVSLYRDKGSSLPGIKRFTSAFLLGWASLRQVDAGRRWEAGETDPENGTRFWTACLNLAVQDLRPIKELVDRAHQRMSSGA